MKQPLEELFFEYNKLKEERRWDEALTILETCRELDPRNKAVHSSLVELYSIRGKIKNVADEYMRYIQALPVKEEYGQITSLIPTLLLFSADKELTINTLIEMFQEANLQDECNFMRLLLAKYYLSNPTKEAYKKIFIRKDVIMFTQDKEKDIKQLLYNVYESKSTDFELRIELARLFGHIKMPQVSMTILQELLSDCLRKKQYDRIEQVIHNIRIITGSEFIIHLAMGDVYHQQEEYDKAAEEYTSALKIDKYHTRALSGLANVLFSSKKYELAIKAYSKVISLNPEEVGALKGMGQAYAKLGEIEKASKFLLDAAIIYLKKAKYYDAFSLCKEVLEFNRENLLPVSIIEKLRARRLIPEEEARRALAKPDFIGPSILPQQKSASDDTIAKERKQTSGLFRSGVKKPAPKGLFSFRIANRVEESIDAGKCGEEAPIIGITSEQEEFLSLFHLPDNGIESEERESIKVQQEEVEEKDQKQKEGESDWDWFWEEMAADKEEERKLPKEGGGEWDWFWEDMVTDQPDTRENFETKAGTIAPETKTEEMTRELYRKEIPSNTTTVLSHETEPLTKRAEEEQSGLSIIDQIVNEAVYGEIKPSPQGGIAVYDENRLTEAPREQEASSEEPEYDREQEGQIENIKKDRAQETQPEAQEIITQEEFPIKKLLISEEICRFLEKFENSILFYENTFSLGIFSTDGEIVWRSKHFSEEIINEITSNKSSLKSFFIHRLFSVMKKLISWTLEYENNNFLYYFIDSQLFILLVVYSKKNIDILQQKLSFAKSKIIEFIEK